MTAIDFWSWCDQLYQYCPWPAQPDPGLRLFSERGLRKFPLEWIVTPM